MVRSRILALAMAIEMLFIRKTAFLRSIPLLKKIHRGITARVYLHDSEADPGLLLQVDFETPFFHLPVEIDETQMGIHEKTGAFQPGSFRFFDWHSGLHIEGMIFCKNERNTVVDGKQTTLASGFSYLIASPPPNVGILGLRIAEGIPGSIRFLWRNALVTMQFDPGYWMLEKTDEGYRVLAIRDDALLQLIVSLSEIGGKEEALRKEAIQQLWEWVEFHGGSMDPELRMLDLLCHIREEAIQQLWEWVEFHGGSMDPELRMLDLLCHIRDWGPVGKPELYPGLGEILERLQVRGREKILFEFFADNWGIRDNRNGRLLAIGLLEQLGTDAAGAALWELLRYARNRTSDPEELALIQGAAQRISPTFGQNSEKKAPEHPRAHHLRPLSTE